MRHLVPAAALVAAVLILTASPGYAAGQVNDENSPLYSLLMQRPGGNSLFLARDELIRPVLLADDETLDAYTMMGLDKPEKIFRTPPSQSEYFRRSGSLFTFMLRRSFDVRQISYDVPVALVPDDTGGERDQGFDQRYQNGPCAGLGRLEADLRGRCVLGPGRYGLIEERMPSAQLMSFGLYHSFSRQLPQNGSRVDPSAILYRALPELIGFVSGFNSRGFKDPLTSFDNTLYSESAHRRVLYGDSVSDLGDECSPELQGSCGFRVDGQHFHDFADRQSGNFQLKVRIADHGKVYLGLDRTLLSSDEFINYGFYTEAELNVLRDLGYDIRPREFFGYTVMGGGTQVSPRRFYKPSSYFAYSDRTGTYDTKKASEVPLGVGAHIMGDYNIVEQIPTIASVGTAAIGMRVDGKGNQIILPSGSVIIENGDYASGIVLAYGRDNTVEVHGRISAAGRKGVGVLADFGSNVLSDTQEYRGSYARVRTMDYLKGNLSERAASTMPLDDDLKGPLAKMIEISGRIDAAGAAVSIGPRAFVKNIVLEGNASLSGGIVSKWDPYFDKGEVFLRSEDQLLPARLQLLSKPGLFPFSTDDYLHRTLHTTLTLGAADGQFGLAAKGDPNAQLSVSGGIRGNSLDVVSVGGHTHVSGTVDVHSVRISDSVLTLSEIGSRSRSGILDLQDGAVLDLVDGKADSLEVSKRAYVAGGAVIRLDAAPDGTLLDNISLPDQSVVLEGTLTVEPGLPFQTVKSLIASPRAFMTFMERFSTNTRQILKKHGFKIRYPHRVWYDSGDVGMEVNCSARGCRPGRFLNSRKLQAESIPIWRYSLSGIGTILILFIAYMYFVYMRSHARVGKSQDGGNI